MNIDLSEIEIATLLESLEYSKDRIRSARDTPPGVRRENMSRVELVADRLREARRDSR